MKFPYALLLALASCVNHNLDNSTGQSLRAAATFCQKPAGEMEWFQSLLLRMETDAGLRGDIYAVSIDGNLIFIHQPAIMSCLGCVLYDCSGNKIAASAVDPKKVIAGMKEENRIFYPYR